MSPGIYYIFYSADGAQDVTEYDEENNFATATISVTEENIPSQSAYRYWFDNRFSESVLTNITLGNTYVLESLIQTISLSKGLHSFHLLRMKMTNGVVRFLHFFLNLAHLYPLVHLDMNTGLTTEYMRNI